jgi:hypothetical protein
MDQRGFASQSMFEQHERKSRRKSRSGSMVATRQVATRQLLRRVIIYLTKEPHPGTLNTWNRRPYKPPSFTSPTRSTAVSTL